MGLLYDVPVVTTSTLISSGLIIGTRNITGNNVIIGSSIAGTKIAFFSSDDVIYNYISQYFSGDYGAILWNSSFGNTIIYAGSYSVEGNITTSPMTDISWIKPPYLTFIGQHVHEGTNDDITLLSTFDKYATSSLAANALGLRFPQLQYPITYHYTNSTVSGPSEAAVGDMVIVSAVPDVDYGITDASTQILVTNNDVAVPYTWDATNQRITFTMPDPT